ncbi:DUF5329 family protein [Pseudocolwellia sp. HL-MZ19]|uniref:DUF5329 family protein n=1 Tax=unclassified Pseudocolwellia TaxID=2848178 RepID=UPI003CEED619
MKFNYVFIIITSVFSINSYASTQDEIDHLLKFVSETSCSYERNGTRHNGQEAVEHINKKYNYYVDDIETTEDFIKYSATKSKMSGKYYKIHCESNAPVTSKEWLLLELDAYRTSKK